MNALRMPLVAIIVTGAITGCQAVPPPTPLPTPAPVQTPSAGGARDVWLDSRGQKIPATYTWPAAHGPYPVVVMAHGHGGSRDEAGAFVRVAAALADAGVASIRVDFPGCGASTESFTVNHLGTMLADVAAARLWVTTLPDVNASAVGLLGYSMGGRVAILATRDERYRALALWAPVADDGAHVMVDFVGGRAEWQRLYRAARAQGHASFTTPWGQDQQLGEHWFTELEQSAPLAAITRFAGAMLVVHGEADEVVPPPVGAAVIGYATSATRRSALTVPGAGHGLGFYNSDVATQERVVDATVAFLANALHEPLRLLRTGQTLKIATGKRVPVARPLRR